MAKLSPADVALLFIDIQPGIVDASHTQPAKTVRRATEISVKIGRALGVPVFVSVVPAGGKAPEAVSELAGLPTFTRGHAGCFDQPEIREAIAATGRKVLAIGGIASEIAVLHGALTAIREGYTVHILVDACGGISERTEHAAYRQIETAGGVLSSVASFFTTVAGDFTQPAGQQTIGALMELIAKE